MPSRRIRPAGNIIADRKPHQLTSEKRDAGETEFFTGELGEVRLSEVDNTEVRLEMS